jgi:hypothetical protein
MVKLLDTFKALVISFISSIVSGEALLQASAAITTGPRGMVAFLNDPTAETSAKLIVGLVVGLTVGLLVIGYVFPVGMQGYHAINFTACGMTSDEQAIYEVLGIFAIIALLLAIIGIAVKNHE